MYCHCDPVWIYKNLAQLTPQVHWGPAGQRWRRFLTGTDGHRPAAGLGERCACGGSSSPLRWPPTSLRWTACWSPSGTLCWPVRAQHQQQQHLQESLLKCHVNMWACDPGAPANVSSIFLRAIKSETQASADLSWKKLTEQTHRHLRQIWGRNAGRYLELLWKHYIRLPISS